MSGGKWGGRQSTTARARLAATLPVPCYRCGRWVTGDRYRDGDTWDVDHVVSRAEGGENRVTNYVVSHSTCNRSAGGKLSAKRKAKTKEVRAVEAERTTKFWNLKNSKNIFEFFLNWTKALRASPSFFVSEVFLGGKSE